MCELHRRVTATGINYPFSFSGTLLKAKGDWRDYLPYVFCLLISYCEPARRKVQNIKHEMMFEQLSCLAAREYVGGKVLRFGAPRKELAPGFSNALTQLCGHVGEWSPVQRRALHHKDGGLDLVAWKPFPDSRTGKLIFFGHCASGGDWDDKINELQPDKFCSSWLGGTKSPVVKTFFIPHRLSPEVFDDRAVAAELFFDRCRIAHCASSSEFRATTSGKVIVWCETILKRLNA